MNVLIAEDDAATANYLDKCLREAGHSCLVCGDGKQALVQAITESFDIAIIDRMLPKLDGLSLVRALRGAGQQFPCLFLSALGNVDDRVAGLRAGGDDYLVKPFAVSELLARLDALMRRQSQIGEKDACLRCGDLEIDRLRHEVRRDGKPIRLQPREFSMLEYLMRHAGHVVTRTMLLDSVWGYHFDPQTNVIDVHISRLRAKIDRGFDRPLLYTIRGSGYMLKA